MGGLRPDIASALEAFGTDATVTRPAPYDVPIATSVVWLTADTGGLPQAAAFKKEDPRRILSVPRRDVPELPTRSLIRAAERPGEDEKDWIVDAYIDSRWDEHRVIVLPA